MKRRNKYWFYREEGTKNLITCRILQELTWRFYFRVIKKWFIPCKECQERLDNIVKIYMDRSSIGEAIGRLCAECTDAINNLYVDAEIILGNKDYEPAVELSRTWLENDDEIHDVTKEEYEENRPYKYL